MHINAKHGISNVIIVWDPEHAAPPNFKYI